MIELRDVSFGYTEDHLIVSGLDHRFEAGTTTGISGPSGKGKSTLLYLAGLLLSPSAGQVIVAGADTGLLSDSERSRLRARQIGFVFQDAALDPSRTIIDNVIEGAVFSGMRRAEAAHHARQLLVDVDVTVPVDRRPGQISGGQAQRVALCRAMLHEPSLVLADEPTGNLDPDSARLVLDHLSRAAQSGATVLIASHDQHVLDSCDAALALP